MSNFILISKDAMCTDYLPVYGNTHFHTPNIDELAAKGTVFRNHYTAAPSTVMSFFSMITGVYGHETKYEMYEKLHDVFQGETLFTKLKDKGYECHILWGDIWMVLPKYFDCYRDDVVIHAHETFRQGVGAHYSHEGFLKPNRDKIENTLRETMEKIRSIVDGRDNIFLWVHFPHVINGQVAYGSDIELFDRYIGEIRTLFPDDRIAITADHGNMNGHKGKICYGFDVYQPASRVPLIVPRMDGMAEYHANSSSTDLYSILFEHRVPTHEFIYSDSAYRAQRHRKLAIVYDHYKYIYNKQTKTEELYDLAFDPTEEFSLIEDYIYDPDRKFQAPSRELYYYPDWEKLPAVRQKLREEKNRIWRNGSMSVVLRSTVKDLIRPIYARFRKKKSTADTTA